VIHFQFCNFGWIWGTVDVWISLAFIYYDVVSVTFIENWAIHFSCPSLELSCMLHGDWKKIYYKNNSAAKPSCAI